MGCDWARCSFCIERIRGHSVVFRNVEDIIADVVSLYKGGARYFRIGRNPNFYYYMVQDVSKVEALLCGIRNQCPDLKMLHIDNVNPESVVTTRGQEITKLIVEYCTSGNIAPFGIESFDPVVRKKNSLNANINQIIEAIGILNEYGQKKGENGLPKFLPGINLMHNLAGQRSETLDYNLYYLNQIMEKGYQTRRLFFRRCSSFLGVSMKENKIIRNNDLYEDWKRQIYENYAIPMLKRVFPSGSILKEAIVEVWQHGDSVLRQLSTCPSRIVIKDVLLPIGTEHNIEVRGILKHRTLLGKLWFE
ncbi:radical SAM protein [Patescibacteria group bacterium]